MNMATKLNYNPPSYKNCSSYEHFKVLVEAWAAVTDVPAEKRAVVLALSLEGCEGNICEKVFASVKLVDMKKDDGLEKVLEFLDAELGKDDLEDCLAKFEDFEDYVKSPSESINQYISNFDQKVSKIKAKGIKLPSEVLAFKLMRRAGLTKEEKLLVISGLNYEKKDDLYEQTQRSLKKFKGEGSSGGGYSGNAGAFSQPAIKVEPTYYTMNQRSVGMPHRGMSMRSRPRPWRGNYGSSWQGMRPSGNESWRGTRPPSNVSWRSTGSDSSFQRGGYNARGRGADPSTAFRFPPPFRRFDKGEKHVNPIGVDGKPLTCDSCKSIRHFVRDCPDTWENLKSVNIAESYVESNNTGNEYYGAVGEYHGQDPSYGEHVYDGQCDGQVYDDQAFHGAVEGYSTDFPGGDSVEHVVLYTGYNKADLVQLEVESHNCGVLDCACTSTVCGKAWLADFLASRSPNDDRPVQTKDGFREFKFGGGVRLKSIKEYALPCYLVDTPVTIYTDVVESDIPLLLSKSAMKRAGVVIDTVNDTATILGKLVHLNLTSSGHYCVPIVKSQTASVCVVESMKYAIDDQVKSLTHLHKQMGHPVKLKLVAFIKDANSWQDKFSAVIDKIYEECNKCKELAKTPSRPVVSLPMASRFNEKVAMDLKMWDNKYILHLIDMWSRYTISVFVSRKTKETIIDNIIIHWIAYFGVMQTVLSDNGGEFRNDEMREVCSILNVEILTTAAESPWQNGLCEKNHGITDMILLKLKDDYPHVRIDVLLRWANMAKNCLQMWSGYSACQLVFGINPNLPNIFNANLPALDESTISRSLAEHLNILHSSRKAFIESECSERIRRALRHRIRASGVVYNRGDRVYYKRDHSLRWLGPAKVIFQDRKIVLLDHGGYYIKVSANLLQKIHEQFVNHGLVPVLPEVPVPVLPENDNPVVSEPLLFHDNLNNDNQPDQNHANDLVVDNANVEQLPVDNNVENDDQLAVVNEVPATRQSNRLLNQQHGWEVYLVTIPNSKHNDAECVLAKEAELQKLQTFSVYEEVPEVGQQCISTRWILWHKGEEVRARLVARGFEEDTSSVAVDSPTIGKCTVRMVLAIAASLHWTIKTTDIKSAFLQGMVLERNVYLIPPVEAKVRDGYVWKLNTCLYGLNDAARQFYNSVVQELMHLGCRKSHLDPSLFYKSNDQGLSGLMVSHIDDFLHAGQSSFDMEVMSKLGKRFLAGRNQECDFKYVGYQVTQSTTGVMLDQNDYIENIKVPPMSAERQTQKNDSLNRQELKQYRSLVGSLNWIVQGSRPDLAFQLIDLSTKFRNGTVDDLIKVRKILQKAKENRADIFYPDLGHVQHWRIVMYADASHANLCEGVSSCVGYIVFLVGERNRCCPLSWKSGKARRIVKSTIAAESVALLDGLEEAIYLKSILAQILSTEPASLPVICITDHQGLWESVRSTKLVEDRRLRIEIAAIKECLLRKDVSEVRLCPSAEQLADCLTKKGADGRKLLSVLQQGSISLQM